ncbi:RND superfamily putative drug exporter [Jatrophihabitans sp. GAS493]|uniref:MMPL family transporter n=1 Tax=Jatrophihabitans sp. GAS493 TaxID=1907575 RepID=UPI000BB6F0BE|nr:MMPL family transporter [Jatrophihabitans sp. GAS493]SOD72182.1 RND superfamily putative drug exporter [Jatrophihabitans sp. GAS493]
MTSLLYKLGAWSARRRLLMIGGWVMLLAVLGVLAGTVAGSTDSSFSIPGTQSQKALDLLSQKFPGTGGASARIVVAAPEGHTLNEPAYTAAAKESLALAAKVPDVIAVTPYENATVSKDKRIAFVDVAYGVPVDQISQESKDALQAAAQPAKDAGLQIEYSGGVIATATKAGNTELYGVIIAFFVLTITFGSLVAAGMPLLMALVGVGVGLLGISALSGVISLNSTAPTLALMLGLAVGIDYTLFILSRHRQHLRDGMDVGESIPLAVATAGGAVVFAGLTVVIALCALTVVGVPFLTVMGLAAAGTVAVTVLLSLTLLPAVLSLLGPRINKGSIGFLARRHERNATKPNGGERWSKLVTAKPWLTLVVGVVGIGIIALPVLDLNLGLPDDSSKPASTTERRAYDLLTEGFGAGFNGPLTLVIYAPGRTDVATLAAQAATDLQKAPDVASVGTPIPNKAGDVAILSVTPASSPSSDATKALVGDIRTAADQAEKESGVSAYVTGTTAVNIDVSNKLSSALPVFIIVIVGLALILLMLVFRSILVPIKAVVGFLLSIAASFGSIVWIFQQGHFGSLFDVQSQAPIVSFLPILVVGILFGLAMDYEVFLVSRIHEDYTHHRDPSQAIRRGMSNSARVVTAAALIMTGVFGGFIFGDDTVIKSLGFALAFGVLIDAFVVRMTLVPAVLKLLGHSAWALPRWLDRILPDLDLEGSKLTHRQPAVPTDAEAQV